MNDSLSKLLFFFDTETTGLPSKDRRKRKDPATWPRLIEIGWVITREDGVVLEKQSIIVSPDGFEIPDAATKIHGITTAEARMTGKPIRDVISVFCCAAARADVYVAHNLSYDMRIILSELIRLDGLDRLPTLPGICTMRSSIKFCAVPGRFGKGFKQVSLSFLYNILFKEKPAKIHRALIDAQTCALCYHELIRRGVNMELEDSTRIFFR